MLREKTEGLPVIAPVGVQEWSPLVLKPPLGQIAAQEPQEQVEMLPAIVLDVPAARRFWIDGEYFLGWIKSDRTPGPLVTTGPPLDPAPGTLGNPTTSVLFDGSRLDYRLNSGARLALGGWISSDGEIGAEISGFVLETHTIHGEANSDLTGSPVIARPFFNVLTAKEDALVITIPSAFGEGEGRLGGIDIFADSRTWGAEANALALGWIGRGRWDILGGFRYLGQKDELRFSQSSTILVPGGLGFLGKTALPPNIVSLKDFFETNNHFYGGQVGLRGEYRAGRWILNLSSAVGVGATCQKLHQEGWTMLTDSSGKSLLAPGGLFVVGQSLGDFERNEFSVMTELAIRLGFQVTERLRTQLGYRFLYWDNVVRPGEQIDRRIDPRQVPSNLAFIQGFRGADPRLLFESTDFWLQGMTAGLVFEF